MVDGVFLYRNGRHLTLDLEATLREAEKQCARILNEPEIRSLFA